MNHKKITNSIIALLTVLGITNATMQVEAASVILPDKGEYTIVPEQMAYTIVPDKTEYTITPSPTVYTISIAKNASVVAPSKEASVVAPSKEASVVAPSKEASVVAPSKEASVVAPSKEASVVVPSKEASVVAPSKEASVVAPSKAKNEQYIYQRRDRYTWKEFTSDRSQLLKESGTLNVIGIGFKTIRNEKSSNKTNLEVYMGDVDYKGHTWGGSPLSSITNYKGFKLESLFYNKTDMKDIDVFFGIGYNKWQRDLKSTANSIGYIENWTLAYTKMGIQQKKDKFSWQLGFKYPLYSQNRVDLFDATIAPEQRVSFFGEVGFKLGKQVDLALTYDSMRFWQSKPVYVPLLQRQVVQPESTMDSWGLKVTGNF